MISRNKQKKIVDFLVDKKSVWEISKILRIDYKTTRKYCERFEPEIKKATGILETMNFDEIREKLK